MKKLIMKINKFLDLPAFNIALGVVGLLVSIFIGFVLSEELHSFSILFGAVLWFSFDSFSKGIDDFFEKKRKAADKE